MKKAADQIFIWFLNLKLKCDNIMFVNHKEIYFASLSRAIFSTSPTEYALQ